MTSNVSRSSTPTVVDNAEAPRFPGWRIWLKAVRPRSFTASTVPIVAATALALVDGSVRPALFVMMLLASIFTHAACNLTNDYFDDRRGVDSEETLGQGGALQSGAISHDELRNGIIVAFGLAVLSAIPVIVAVGPIIVWIGLASAAAAFLYTAGPVPLAYFALGEVTVFFAMGIGMVCGAYYVHTGTVSLPSVFLGTAIGLLAAAFLHANNVRDIDTDRVQNKRTLANLLPGKGSWIEYALLVMVPYVLVIAMVVVQPVLFPMLLVWISFPTAFTLVVGMQLATRPVEFNRITRNSAGLHLRYSSLVSVGLILAALISR